MKAPPLPPGNFVTESQRAGPPAKRLSVFRRKSVSTSATELFEAQQTAEPARPLPPSQPPKRSEVMDDVRKMIFEILQHGGAPIETDARKMQEGLDKWTAAGAPLSDSAALVMMKVYGAKPPPTEPKRVVLPRADPLTTPTSSAAMRAPQPPPIQSVSSPVPQGMEA
jgi:hypothetical protein